MACEIRHTVEIYSTRGEYCFKRTSQLTHRTASISIATIKENVILAKLTEACELDIQSISSVMSVISIEE
jgi:hypothetical protein